MAEPGVLPGEFLRGASPSRGFGLESPPSLEDRKGWNREKLLSRACLDEEGAAWVSPAG